MAADGATNWVKPQVNQIKINVDAALFGDTSHYGFGIVARNHQGELVEGRTCRRVGVQSVEVAEAMGIREALSWTKQRGWTGAVVESDCLTAVRAIRSGQLMDSPFGLVVEDCRRLLRELSDVSLLFVYRSANSVAHSFVWASYSFPERLFSGGYVPAELLSQIVEDS